MANDFPTLDNDNNINTDYNSIDEQVEYVDFIYIDGSKITPERLAGSIKNRREIYFNLDLIATPIVAESKKVIRPERYTADELRQMDTAPYTLKGGVSAEKRFRTEFDYYAALIRACEDNADKIAILKRQIVQTYNLVHAMYVTQFDTCLNTYGKQVMGNSDAERHAWFHGRYPALFNIDTMLEGFLDEVDIELERWGQFAKAASRGLSATELSYHASGKLYTNKAGKYDAAN